MTQMEIPSADGTCTKARAAEKNLGVARGKVKYLDQRLGSVGDFTPGIHHLSVVYNPFKTNHFQISWDIQVCCRPSKETNGPHAVYLYPFLVDGGPIYPALRDW